MRAYRVDPLAFVRLLVFFISTHIGRIIAGLLLLISGVIYGLGSHQVSYQQAPAGKYQMIGSKDGYYLQLNGGQTFFSIKAIDFTPWPDPATMDTEHRIDLLIYKNDPQHVDIPLDDGTHLTGTSYLLVQFTFSNTNGQSQQSYTTAEYREHPSGYYDNRWLWGGIGYGLGLFFFALTLFVYWLDRRKMDASLAGQPESGTIKIYGNNPWASIGRVIRLNGHFQEPLDPKNLAK